MNEMRLKLVHQMLEKLERLAESLWEEWKGANAANYYEGMTFWRQEQDFVHARMRQLRAEAGRLRTEIELEKLAEETRRNRA